MDVCSAQQCVLSGNMLSHHLFLLQLLCPSSYLLPLHPLADGLSVCVCIWQITQSEASDAAQKKDDENQGE